MVANTAFEALYQLIGLGLHESLIKFIASDDVLRACIALLVGYTFFRFVADWVSRYIPFFISTKRTPLSRVFKLFMGVAIGFSLLRVDTPVTSETPKGTSWSENRYVRERVLDIKDHYRVSYIFKVMVNTAEYLAKRIDRWTDSFSVATHSQVDAPNFLYKAILGAASDSISNPELRQTIDFYTEHCLSQVLPQFNPTGDVRFIDRFFARDNAADRKLRAITIEPTHGPWGHCLGLKNHLNETLKEYAYAHSSTMDRVLTSESPLLNLKHGFGKVFEAWSVSNLLVNHYLDRSEGTLGMEKEVELPGTSGRIVQYLNRLFSMEGFMSIFGGRDVKGATVAASRSLDFGEQLARAPHIKGAVKLALNALFPILVFFLATGNFKPLIWWWLTYFSVCLWSPIWTAIYHIMTSLVFASDVTQEFGRLGDGVSLYAATLVTSRLYQTFAVYAAIQTVIGPIFTVFFLHKMAPILRDSQGDSVPEGVHDAAVLGTKVGGLL